MCCKKDLAKIKNYFDFTKGSFKKCVRWGGEVSLKSEQKRTGGEGLLSCVYVRFFKKNAEIFIIKFYSYSPVFPIDYNGSMKY